MGALGVIYNLGSDLDVGDQSDQDRLAARMRAAKWDHTGLPVYNVPVALSIMVFFARMRAVRLNAGDHSPRDE